MLEILCSVCTDTLFIDDNVAATSCCHVFHEKCLTDWIARSKSCPECRADCTQEETRRLYFNYEPKFNTTADAKLLENEITINRLKEELASQKQKFEEQLCVENEIRREMHQTNQNLKKQIKNLTEAAKHPSSSNSAQAEKVVSKVAKYSGPAAIPAIVPTIDLSVQAPKLKPKATINAATSVDLNPKHPSSSNSAQAEKVVSKVAKYSGPAAIPAIVPMIDLSVQAPKLKPIATINAATSVDLNHMYMSAAKPSTSGSTHNVLVTAANSKTSTKHKMNSDQLKDPMKKSKTT